MIGRRVADGTAHSKMRPGDYGIGADGGWYARTPNDFPVHLPHVTLHADGRISAKSVSVRTTRDGQPFDLFLGHLEKGVWRTLKA